MRFQNRLHIADEVDLVGGAALSAEADQQKDDDDVPPGLADENPHCRLDPIVVVLEIVAWRLFPEQSTGTTNPEVSLRQVHAFAATFAAHHDGVPLRIDG